MKFKIQDIARIAIFAGVIASAEALESFLPSLKDGGSLKLSEVAVTALVVLTLTKFRDKIYSAKIMFTATLLAVIICYFTGMFKYATTPTILLLDYVIPFLSPIIIVLAMPDSIPSKFLLTFIAATIAFISHVVSGVVVWKVPLMGSITYNIWYCLLTLAAQLIMVAALHKRKI